MLKRLINVWLSNLITERLLASPLFHRMAARTHFHVSNITDKGIVCIYLTSVTTDKKKKKKN
jgi:hypothetical protein